MLSSRLLMSLARLLRPCDVKKLVGLSRAELTLLPVAKRFWVVDSSSAVDCSESRFWRTDAERTIPVIFHTFLIGRLVDRETKPLRKHESAPHCRFPDHAGGAPISSCTVAEFENDVDN